MIKYKQDDTHLKLSQTITILIILFIMCILFTSLLIVAPSGTASQSSIYKNCSASKAIDGDRNPHFINCTHTDLKSEPKWWRLILPAMYRITSISITNRIQVHERINNVKILIGNSPVNKGNNNPICAVIPSIPSGSTRTFNCGGMIGRFVNVYLNLGILTMCEFEVYGGRYIKA
uniref:Fucolectin tachylectin-4 pentraxin-1 domain-containing protein n=1 Tax=Cyclopterus lumpus TaxID=8103 RepID=A0A8C2XJY7_CYCLU